MNTAGKATGVGWALPFALLGTVIGFLLTAQHLPLAASPYTPTEIVSIQSDRLAAPPPPDVKAQPVKKPEPVRTSPVKAPPVRPPLQKDPFDHNYALAKHGASVTGGSRPELLIDGKASPYDGSTGYAYTSWNSKTKRSFVVSLKKPVTVNVVRFLLWDKGERFYRYKLETSAEPTGENWFMLSDRSQEPLECRSWQVIAFKPRVIARLRLTGTYNSANNGFHVVEFEAYHVPGGLDFPWIESEF